MKKTYFLKGAAIAALMTSASAAHAECGDVTITEMNWASSAVVTAVSSFLMEQGLGCNVQKEGKLVELADVLSDGGVEAWWIPAYLAKSNPELTTWEGIMANPELVGGKFHDCPSGWACDIINNNNLIALNAADSGLERFQHGSGETLQTSIAAAFEEEAPWFGYYWAPTAVLGKYPMVAVEVGEYNAEAHNCNGDVDCANPSFSAYPASKVVTAVAGGFAEREPQAAALMANVSFSNEQMGEVLAWRLDKNASYDEAAVYFLTNYKDVWAEWLDAEAKENLAAILQ